MDELVRFALAATVIAAVLVAVVAVRHLFRRRLRAQVGTSAEDLALRFGLASGEPAILYFSGSRCVQCLALQEPALQRLTREVRVAVRKIDAAVESDIARRFHILSVPATVVLDASHRIRGVNVGFADENQLREQLA